MRALGLSLSAVILICAVFFAVDEDVRAGYSNISTTVRIERTASDEDIARLKAAVDAHCPVLDIISNQTPVDITVEKTAALQAAE